MANPERSWTKPLSAYHKPQLITLAAQLSLQVEGHTKPDYLRQIKDALISRREQLQDDPRYQRLYVTIDGGRRGRRTAPARRGTQRETRAAPTPATNNLRTAGERDQDVDPQAGQDEPYVRSQSEIRWLRANGGESDAGTPTPGLGEQPDRFDFLDDVPLDQLQEAVQRRDVNASANRMRPIPLATHANETGSLHNRECSLPQLFVPFPFKSYPKIKWYNAT